MVGPDRGCQQKKEHTQNAHISAKTHTGRLYNTLEIY